MKKFITLLNICTLMAFFGCTVPSGDYVTEHFPLSTGYYSIFVSDGMIVTVSDQVDDIVVSANEAVMEKMHVELKNGRLRIYRNDFSFTYPTKTHVTLPYDPDLKTIEVNMDSEFHTDYGIEADEVKVKLDMDSKFYGYILADELELIANNDSEIPAYPYPKPYQTPFPQISELQRG